MDISEKSPSDDEILARIVDLTESGRLDWKQVYENGGTPPTEDIEESTAPQGYMTFDEYFGFGRTAVHLDQDEDGGGEYPAIDVSGNRLDVTVEAVERLREAIEEYIDAVQAGRVPTMADRINRKVQEQVEPLRREIKMLEDELAHKDQRVGRLISVIENVTRSEDGPPLTKSSIENVLEKTDMEVSGPRDNPTLNMDSDDLEVAIESER